MYKRQAKELAGQKVVFNVTVHDIKKRVIPDLDEEFFKDLDMEGVSNKEMCIRDRNWNEYVSLREYTAIVSGHPKEESGQIIQYLEMLKKN